MVRVMIDIHSHILPGIDDGARNLNETLAMCRMADNDGITHIAATPHCMDGEYETRPDVVLEGVSQINETLRSHDLRIRVLPGMEVRIVPELLELLFERKILTLNNGRYVLLELHPTDVPVGLEDFIGTITSAGFGVVICHPEKNMTVQRNPDVLIRMLDRFHSWELLFQISADSLRNHAGPVAYKTAKYMLRHHAVHIIAADAHSTQGRVPRLSDAVRIAAGIVGDPMASMMVTSIPKAVVAGTDFPKIEWSARQKRWWSFLTR